MKISAVLLILFFMPAAALSAPIKAKTESGKTVILNDNGTWKYAEEKKVEPTGKAFTKPETSTLEVKGKRNNFSLYIDPQKWTVSKKSLNDEAEVSLVHSSGDAYAVVISERIKFPLENLENIVLQNAKNAAPDAEIVSSENRIVNGKQARFIVITGSLEGISFIYNYYLFSDDNGSTQVTAFTSKELYDEFSSDFVDLLNGYVATEAKK